MVIIQPADVRCMHLYAAHTVCFICFRWPQQFCRALSSTGRAAPASGIGITVVLAAGLPKLLRDMRSYRNYALIESHWRLLGEWPWMTMLLCWHIYIYIYYINIILYIYILTISDCIVYTCHVLLCLGAGLAGGCLPLIWTPSTARRAKCRKAQEGQRHLASQGQSRGEPAWHSWVQKMLWIVLNSFWKIRNSPENNRWPEEPSDKHWRKQLPSCGPEEICTTFACHMTWISRVKVPISSVWWHGCKDVQGDFFTSGPGQ